MLNISSGKNHTIFKIYHIALPYRIICPENFASFWFFNRTLSEGPFRVVNQPLKHLFSVQSSYMYIR